MSHEKAIDLEALATLVRSKRQTLGMSLRRVAEATGISAATLSRIELQQSVPDTSTATALAEWLGVRLDEFLVGNGAPAPEIRRQLPRTNGLAVHLRAKRRPDPEVMNALMNLAQHVYESLRRSQAN